MKVALLIVLALIACGATAQGCVTIPKDIGGATFCEIAQGPIMWSPADTRFTKEQVDTYNRKGKAICGWGKTKR